MKKNWNSNTTTTADKVNINDRFDGPSSLSVKEKQAGRTGQIFTSFEDYETRNHNSNYFRIPSRTDQNRPREGKSKGERHESPDHLINTFAGGKGEKYADASYRDRQSSGIPSKGAGRNRPPLVDHQVSPKVLTSNIDTYNTGNNRAYGFARESKNPESHLLSDISVTSLFNTKKMKERTSERFFPPEKSPNNNPNRRTGGGAQEDLDRMVMKSTSLDKVKRHGKDDYLQRDENNPYINPTNSKGFIKQPKNDKSTFNHLLLPPRKDEPLYDLRNEPQSTKYKQLLNNNSPVLRSDSINQNNNKSQVRIPAQNNIDTSVRYQSEKPGKQPIRSTFMTEKYSDENGSTTNLAKNKLDSTNGWDYKSFSELIKYNPDGPSDPHPSLTNGTTDKAAALNRKIGEIASPNAFNNNLGNSVKPRSISNSRAGNQQRDNGDNLGYGGNPSLILEGGKDYKNLQDKLNTIEEKIKNFKQQYAKEVSRTPPPLLANEKFQRKPSRDEFFSEKELAFGLGSAKSNEVLKKPPTTFLRSETPKGLSTANNKPAKELTSYLQDRKLRSPTHLGSEYESMADRKAQNQSSTNIRDQSVTNNYKHSKPPTLEESNNNGIFVPGDKQMHSSTRRPDHFNYPADTYTNYSQNNSNQNTGYKNGTQQSQPQYNSEPSTIAKRSNGLKVATREESQPLESNFDPKSFDSNRPPKVQKSLKDFVTSVPNVNSPKASFLVSNKVGGPNGNAPPTPAIPPPVPPGNYISKNNSKAAAGPIGTNLSGSISPSNGLGKFKLNNPTLSYMNYLQKTKEIINSVGNVEDVYNQFKNYIFQFLQGVHFIKMLKPIDFTQIREKSVDLPRKYSHLGRKSIIFDLDETLVHCNESTEIPADVYLPVSFPSGDVVKVRCP